jgi:hypothetical protein
VNEVEVVLREVEGSCRRGTLEVGEDGDEVALLKAVVEAGGSSVILDEVAEVFERSGDNGRTTDLGRRGPLELSVFGVE